MRMRKEKGKSDYETILDCFETVIFYNGYSDFFIDVYKLFQIYMKEGGAEKHEGYFEIIDTMGKIRENDRFVYGQLQVLRMMLVEMFGDCGTSPRTGWIVDEEGFNEFMSDLSNRLTKLSE